MLSNILIKNFSHADKNNQEFPDRRGFFTGHRIPLELFGEETLRHIELIEEAKEKNSEGRFFYFSTFVDW